MAENSLFGRLKRLFNNNVVVRKVGKDRLRVIDNDHLQSLGNPHNSRYVDRFTRLHGVRPNSSNTYNPNYNYFSSKTELYTDYETMDQDAIINSALDIYADETVMKDDFGDVLRITSNNDNIKKILHNLFYDVLNVEFNLWPWVRNMCKYGDLYLKLDITEEIGVINVTPLSAYEIIREEGMDQENPYHVQFKQLGGGNVTYENFEIAHFRLLTDSNFLPYGRSMIEGGRKVWKQLTLMEDAMLIHRIMRAPEKRIFKIDVGNIPPNEVDNYMQKIINQMKKTPYVDQQTGDYNLKFNMQNMLEDYFLPVRGGQSGTEIDTLSGMEFTGIDDIEYLRNKMMAALKVPKAFIGYEEGVSGKATLAAEDVRFARTIERIQRIIISELHKIAIVHLSAQGFENAELVDFELSMTSPSTIYEQEKLTLYNTKVDLAGSMIEKKLMPRDWIFKNIFNFSAEEIEEIELGIIQDQKETFRMTKIAEEGEDPLDTFNKEKEAEGSEGGEEGAEGEKEAGGEEAGSEKEQGANPFGEGVNDNLAKDYDKRSKNRNTPKVPEGGWPGAGRPKEGVKYNTHEHPRGYDPIGKVAWKNARNESMNVIKKYGLEKLVTKKTKLLSEQSSIIDESNILPEEI
jgi:hypothetical protein